ncbi:hypothetical protein ES288_D09G077000v1 [Gossypium darwinii]|uniref:Uncharacterized protein n=1 Tax=Gossypium darwinii TaxID=34276 RepID=A0A5D2B6V4_GOSDA|nr:hypothetical protein ES288_D09G077000v1 [Gossypium darwinii]
MGASAPVTASLRAKLSQPARSETKGRPSTPLDPNRATEERPTGGVRRGRRWLQKACAMGHWAKAAALEARETCGAKRVKKP